MIFIACLFVGGAPARLQAQGVCPGFTAETGQQIYHEVEFGESIVFHLCLHNIPQVAMASISVYIEGAEEPLQGFADAPADAREGDLINLNHTINLGQAVISPFTNVEYVWEITYLDSSSTILEAQRFQYTDNRIDWQDKVSDDGTIVVYTDEFSASVAPIAIEILEQARPEINQVIPADLQDNETPIKVYLYPSSELFLSALRLTGLNFVAGKASPEIGVMMVPLGELEAADVELAQRLPHELVHLIIYRATETQHPNFPAWVDEGLATRFETYSNPSFAVSMDAVTDDTQLIPFAQLCTNLPQQPPEAVLRGYAQSNLMVDYLIANYGESGVQEIVRQVASGVPCDLAVEAAIGVTGDELAAEWLDEKRPVFPEWGAPEWLPIIVIGIFFLAVFIVIWARTDSMRTIGDYNR